MTQPPTPGGQTGATYPLGIGIRHVWNHQMNLVTIQVTDEEIARNPEVAEAVRTLTAWSEQWQTNHPLVPATNYPKALPPHVDNTVDNQEKP